MKFFLLVWKQQISGENFSKPASQQASKRSASQEAASQEVGWVSQCTNPSPRGWGFTQIPRPRELLRESLLELAPRDNCVTATDGHHAEHDDRPADEFGDYR